jgi:hypothetical protein
MFHNKLLLGTRGPNLDCIILHKNLKLTKISHPDFLMSHGVTKTMEKIASNQKCDSKPHSQWLMFLLGMEWKAY